ncbi:MerR family DNA-binding transcriptional regulator [Virgibacillus byunsanensis]|uniref:MerR family DNA-binding transcriptional regulator n=1 Tax=Virgibacillus byunsanensis TaxID=570945 RepID=A0ABW3LI47_9BACI
MGELAKECDINKETVRYYERIGVTLNLHELDPVTFCILKKQPIVSIL